MMKRIKKYIIKLMRRISDLTGSHASFFLAIVLVMLWGVTGPLFNWSEGWQLFINTTTTIITFLMVFCIQYSQNRDTREIKLKLNAIVRENREQFEEIEKLLEEDD